jgi:hypothetical protein
MRLRVFGIAGLLIVSLTSWTVTAAAECGGKPVKFRVAKKYHYERSDGRPVRWFHIAVAPMDNSQERLTRLGCQLDRKFGRKDARVEVLIFTSYEIARLYTAPGSESPLTARQAEAPLVAWYERDDKTGENYLSYYPDPLNKRESEVRLDLTGLCKCPHDR